MNFQMIMLKFITIKEQIKQLFHIKELMAFHLDRTKTGEIFNDHLEPLVAVPQLGRY